MSDQPRWPAGTPIAPGGHGPGGGRWRDGDGASGPADWAERVVSAIGRRIGSTRRLMTHEQVASYLGRDDWTRFAPTAGGGQGSAEFREYSDGTRLVYKHMFDGDPDEADAEVEASLVGWAIGAPVPAVVLDPASQHDGLLMQYIEPVDMPFAFRRQETSRRLGPHGGEDAWRIALLDTLIGNRDRHELNAIPGEDGHIYGIDHGVAFYDAVFHGGQPDWDVMSHRGNRWVDLIERFRVTEQGVERFKHEQVHFTATTLEQARERVATLEHLIRPLVFTGVMRTLGVLIENSSGSHDLDER